MLIIFKDFAIHGTQQALQETPKDKHVRPNSTYLKNTIMKHTHYQKRYITPALALAGLTSLAMGGTEAVAAEAPSSMDWLKVSGYAAIAYTYTDSPGIFSSDKETFADGNTPFDAVKVGFQGDYENFGGYVSLFYTPGVAADEAGILDAYATYKAGDFTITAGKYLSYLGYEAFDAVNMTQITYANTLGAIPAYHNGIKVDYSTDIIGAGLSVSDSIRGGSGFWTGDEEFSDDQGYEAYVVYKGINKLTLWGGVAYENTADAGLDDFVTYDLWASYDVTDKLTVAGEIAYHDSGVSGIQGLAFAKYSFTDKFSTVVRMGFDDVNGGANNYRYTVAPTYAFNDNVLVRGELTFNDTTTDDADFVFSGIQAIVKF